MRGADIAYTPTPDSGIPTNCTRSSTLTWPHLGETRTIDGRTLHFRAEVGLLSRNIVIEGDYDERLCPLADMADDGVTRLSCNQFGGQIFLHSPVRNPRLCARHSWLRAD